MTAFANTVVVDRPQEKVFAFLADLENVPRWNYAITVTTKTSPGPVGVGTTYSQTREVPTKSRETLVITDFEPDRYLAIEGTLAAFPARLEYRLEDRNGRTELTNTIDLELKGPIRLAGGLAVGRVKSAVEKNLLELKRLLEADA